MTRKYIEAVSDYYPHEVDNSVFIAGGITGCPDWQKILCDELKDTNVTILNPRRKDFDVRDPDAGPEQIRWEWQALQDASLISFWFPEETLCPITLFELGKWSGSDKPILVGCHPNYKRRIDVEVQMALERPTLEVVTTLRGLAEQIRRKMD